MSGVHEFFANGLLVHNCADAGLYAYRAAWHFLHIDVKPKPDKGSAAYYDELESVILQKLESPNERPWWEPDDDTIDSFNSFD